MHRGACGVEAHLGGDVAAVFTGAHQTDGVAGAGLQGADIGRCRGGGIAGPDGVGSQTVLHGVVVTFAHPHDVGADAVDIGHGDDGHLAGAGGAVAEEHDVGLTAEGVVLARAARVGVRGIALIAVAVPEGGAAAGGGVTEEVEVAPLAGLVLHGNHQVAGVVVGKRGAEVDAHPAGLANIHAEVGDHSGQRVDGHKVACAHAGAVGLGHVDIDCAGEVAGGHRLHIEGDAVDAVHTVQFAAGVDHLRVAIFIK